MLKVRESRTHHHEEYSTWSDPIVAKEQVGNTHDVVLHCCNLKYYDAFEMD